MNCLSCDYRDSGDEFMHARCNFCDRFSHHSSLNKSELSDTQEEAYSPVDRPKHYVAEDGTEVKDVLVSFGFHTNSHRWNALKYLFRADHKGTRIQDLRKAARSIEYEIALIEEGKL